MMTLPCLGGTNRTLTVQNGVTLYVPFKRDERGANIVPLEVETYHLDKHPVLGAYWRHESLTTPEAIAAALVERNAWQARHDAERNLSLFSGAAADREFRERMDPLNLQTAASLLPVLLGERRSNQWREMDRSGWSYALGRLNHYPRNKLARADTVKLEGCGLEVWYDRQAFRSAEGSSQLDHAVLLIFTRQGQAYWWGNEHAILDLMETVFA